MTDYNKIRQFCQQESDLTVDVLDNFLVYYAGEKEKLPQEFISLLHRFRHAIDGMPSSWIPSITTQFIAHRLFKSDGLIKKYLNHVAVKNLDPEQYTFLQLLSDTPWRFSFSESELSHPRIFTKWRMYLQVNTTCSSRKVLGNF
jgi:hypothetical protein